MSKHRVPNARPGSIYLVVLVTVMVVTTMVLTGIALRKSMNDRYRLGNRSAEAHNAARSAAEVTMALALESSDFLARAKTGTVVSDTTLGDTTINATALDADTGLAVTDSTETINITAVGSRGDARSMIGFQLEAVNAYAELLASKGATSYWPLDEPVNSTTLTDLFGVIDGTYEEDGLVGNTGFDDGGTAFVIGGNQKIAEILHDSSFEKPAGTIVIWAQFKSMTSSIDQAIFSKEDNDTPNFDIALYVESSQLKLRINSNYSFLDRDYSVSIASIDDQQWHHFAYSFGSGGTRLYVDGNRVVYDPGYTIGLSYSAYSFSETNRERWYLGARRYTGAKTNLINGALARFAFIPKQLGDAEIAELMQAQLSAKRFEVVDGTFDRVVE